MKQMKRKNGQKGFSMVELIIVVAIIAILAVVGVQAFGSIQRTAKLNVAKSNATTLVGAINQYNAVTTAAKITGSPSSYTNAGLVSQFDNNNQLVKAPTFSTDIAAEAAIRSVIIAESPASSGNWVATINTTLYDAETALAIS